MFSEEMKCCCFGESLKNLGNNSLIMLLWFRFIKTFDWKDKLFVVLTVWKILSVNKSWSVRKFQLLGIPAHLDKGHCFLKSSQKIYVYAYKFGKFLQKHRGFPTRGNDLCDKWFAGIKTFQNVKTVFFFNAESFDLTDAK